MPRRAAAGVRPIEPDPVHRSKLVQQVINKVMLDAQSQQGGAYKRKDDIFRMAQANKAFAHYRW